MLFQPQPAGGEVVVLGSVGGKSGGWKWPFGKF